MGGSIHRPLFETVAPIESDSGLFEIIGGSHPGNHGSQVETHGSEGTVFFSLQIRPKGKEKTEGKREISFPPFGFPAFFSFSGDVVPLDHFCEDLISHCLPVHSKRVVYRFHFGRQF